MEMLVLELPHPWKNANTWGRHVSNSKDRFLAAEAGQSIYFGQSGSDNLPLDQAKIRGFTRTGGGGILAFYTNGTYWGPSTERVRIDNAGNVGIGTTSPSKNSTSPVISI
jgi:hypothetical protein